MNQAPRCTRRQQPATGPFAVHHHAAGRRGAIARLIFWPARRPTKTAAPTWQYVLAVARTIASTWTDRASSSANRPVPSGRGRTKSGRDCRRSCLKRNLQHPFDVGVEPRVSAKGGAGSGRLPAPGSASSSAPGNPASVKLRASSTLPFNRNRDKIVMMDVRSCRADQICGPMPLLAVRSAS